MERKLLLVVAFVIATFAFISCEYDDDALWNEMESVKDRITALEEAASKTNSDIAALQAIVNAMQANVYVTDVATTEEGCTITFSDGNSVTISNGKDGANAPVVSVKEDEDGNYYWTLDGEWLLIGENKVRANGQDAVAPQVRINEETKEWEISTNGGKTWVSTEVVAEGKKDGSVLFKSINTSKSDYVTFTLADGTNIKLARYDESAPKFVIKDAPAVVVVEYGKSEKFDVTANNVADYVINTPEGWQASYAKKVLTITAPAKNLCHYDEQGTVAITVVSDSGKSAIVKLDVSVKESEEKPVEESYELRYLTFEDKDVKFSPYCLDYADDYAGREIKKWSELIDDPQYSGPLLYGNSYVTGVTDAMYYWNDKGNTELCHAFPDNGFYGTESFCFASGGHAISNYWGAGYADEDRDGHIAKYYGQDYVDEYKGQPGADASLGWFCVQLMTPVEPHSGDNFAVHYGYKDSYCFIQNLPEWTFADGEPRVIDHMWVTNTNYTLNQLYNGVKSEEGNTFGGNWTGLKDNAWLKIVAQGFDDPDADKDAEPISEVEFYLVRGMNVVEDWQKWDLSGLGKVAKVRFNFLYSEDMGGDYGFTIPGYFAYDDVAVRFEK